MNIVLQRRIDRWIGTPLCWLTSFLWPRQNASMPEQPKALLVILLSEMGSLVLAIPMFQQLRLRYPNARIYALVFEKNRELLDILNLVAPSDVLTIRDNSAVNFIKDFIKILWKLGRLGLAVVIDCELFARVSSLLARFSEAPIHVGFHSHTQEGLYRGSFINRPVLYNPYLHMSHQYLNLATALTATDMPRVKRQIAVSDLFSVPQTYFSPSEIDVFWQQLYRDYPNIQDQKLVLVYPGGGALPIRAWPQESYVRLTKALLDDGLAVGVIGLKSDQIQAQDLVTQCSSSLCVNLAGYTKNIRDLLLLFQRAVLLITNDGGPGQFAALTSVPSIVLFGPETPLLYGPLSPYAHCFFTQMSCSPCLTAYNHRNTPCNGNNLCLKYINSEDVIAKARTLLKVSTS